MDELLNDFIVETTESLQQVDVDLVALEADPSDASRVDGIFRLVHTIKGTSGFMNLKRLEKVAHAGENVLGLMRDRTITVESDGVSVILQAVDRVRDLIEAVGTTGEEPAGSDDDILSALDAYMRAALVDGSEAAAASEPEPAEEPAAPTQLDEMSALAGEVSLEELDRLFAETEVEDHSEDAFAAIAEMDLSDMGPGEGADASEVCASEPAATTVPASQAPVKEPRAKAAAPQSAQPAAAKPEPGRADVPVAAQSIRVSVDLLENLMTMVSELVLTRNQLLQLVRGQGENAFSVPLQRLNQITTDLQEGVMKARMQPIGNAWSKLPRIVRDLSHELGKDIRLDMFGQETELDRQVLELIKDPLTHMVRNSGDHGIETPDVRAEAGKPRQGVIRLDARHEGGQIVIELIDDGRGPRPQSHPREGRRQGARCRRGRGDDDREAGRPLHLPPRLLDGRGRHGGVRARRRDGRREDEYREDRRHGRPHHRGRPRHDLPDQDPAHPRDRLLLDRRGRRGALRRAADERAGARADLRDLRTPHRDDRGDAGPAAARPAPPARAALRRPQALGRRA